MKQGNAEGQDILVRFHTVMGFVELDQYQERGESADTTLIISNHGRQRRDILDHNGSRRIFNKTIKSSNTAVITLGRKFPVLEQL